MSKPLTRTPHRLRHSLLLHLLFPPTSPRLTLLNLSTYLSTTSGLDKCLMLIQYPAKIVVAVLLVLAKRVKGKEVRRRLMDLWRGLGELSGVIGEGRTMMRLFGLIPMLASLPSVLSPPPSQSGTLTHLLSLLQTSLLLLYYPLENLTYLSSKRSLPLPISSSSSSKSNPHPNALSPATEARWSLLSCRAWAGWVIVEFVRLFWVEGRGIRERGRRVGRELSGVRERRRVLGLRLGGEKYQGQEQEQGGAEHKDKDKEKGKHKELELEEAELIERELELRKEGEVLQAESVAWLESLVINT